MSDDPRTTCPHVVRGDEGTAYCALDATAIEQRDAQIAALQAWKAEAIEVIRAWEDVWYALGQPGELGESKAIAALRVVLSRRDGDQ